MRIVAMWSAAITALVLVPLVAHGAAVQPNLVADADAGVAPAPAAPAADFGTRWVFAAAVAGLLAGGVIAHYRKKRKGTASGSSSK
jgi:hypothetical protein